MIAQHARLGNITKASLDDSISRFKRFVNDFKQENKINYDLVERKTVSKRDSEYLYAVERGDMETAQRMVDEAKAVSLRGDRRNTQSGRIRKGY